MGHHPLAADRALASARAGDAAGEIRWDSVAAVVELALRRRGRPDRERLRLVAEQHAGDDVARPIVPRAAAERRDPGLAIPGGDRAVRAERRALLDHTRRAVVLPLHLVLPRVLDPDGGANRLRQDRGVERYRVGAVQAVAARTALEHDPHGLDRPAE